MRAGGPLGPTDPAGVPLGTFDVTDPSFAAAAAWLAGAAGVLLGWRPGEFWAATPAELGAVLRALTGDEGAAPPDADMIRRLMKEFPDG